ncbi:Oligopeptide transport system permease protein OppB [bacterium HR10]|nr:Oligopeptide transport system permease protein OppB [bacterium HR10]
MGRYILKRLLFALPLLWLVLTLTFFLVRWAPGKPFRRERAVPAEIEAHLDRHYGLDQPWPVQYANYLRGLARLDFGPSYRYPEVTVREILWRGFRVSAPIGFVAYALALGVGVPLGVGAALRPRAVWVRALMGVAVLGVSTPNFVLGPLLVLLFSLTLYWVPPAGWGEGRHLVLPVLTLSAAYIAYIARLTQSGLQQALAQDYLRTARAKGLRPRAVLLRHALRPALLPVLSFTGPSLAFLLAGTVVIEKIFAIPGLGHFFVQAALNRDYTLILGIVSLTSVLLIVLNLVADIAMARLDPRITLR